MASIRRVDLGASILTSALVFVGCVVEQGEPGTHEEVPEGEWGDNEAKALSTQNGLSTMNGLTSTNGLMTINGLTTSNGLKVVNGLKVLNGMPTRNGLKVINGLSVDCVGKTVGTTCTGDPDGLFNRTTGVMKDAAGVVFATYVTRCALRPDQSIRVMQWDRTLVTLTGEIGLAPEWLSGTGTDPNGFCNTDCQERVSACLMALSNASGAHVSVAMTSGLPQIGTNTLSTHPYQEGFYFGNIFDSPPRFFVSSGRDYTLGRQIIRSCLTTDSRQQWGYPSPGCSFRTGGTCFSISGTITAQYCGADGDGDPLTNDWKYWYNPLTVWRTEASAPPPAAMYVKGTAGDSTTRVR